jgi:hypothetical protein
MEYHHHPRLTTVGVAAGTVMAVTAVMGIMEASSITSVMRLRVCLLIKTMEGSITVRPLDIKDKIAVHMTMGAASVMAVGTAIDRNRRECVVLFYS